MTADDPENVWLILSVRPEPSEQELVAIATAVALAALATRPKLEAQGTDESSRWAEAGRREAICARGALCAHWQPLRIRSLIR